MVGGKHRWFLARLPMLSLDQPVVFQLLLRRLILGLLQQLLQSRVDSDGTDQAEVKQRAHVKHKIAVQILGENLLPLGFDEHVHGQWNLTVANIPEIKLYSNITTLLCLE